MAEENLKIGDVADDGWVYAGISGATGRDMFVAPADAGAMTPHEATKIAKALQKSGIKEARLPSNGELGQAFNLASGGKFIGMARSKHLGDESPFYLSSTKAEPIASFAGIPAGRRTSAANSAGDEWPIRRSGRALVRFVRS